MFKAKRTILVEGAVAVGHVVLGELLEHFVLALPAEPHAGIEAGLLRILH